MIIGTHVVVASRDAAADHKFFQDVLGFKSVDPSDAPLHAYQPRHERPV
jgi:catechol 2,3-dioxygenase-like lactoylglutathione lyase family enzyme